MSEQDSNRPDHQGRKSGEIKIQGPGSERLDAAMREAVEAVEQVAKRTGRKLPEDPADGPEEHSAQETGVEVSEDQERAHQVEQLEQELSSLKDLSMRTLADFDNFRKRTERERKDLLKYSVEGPMREFLPIMDNLDRALASSGDVDDLKAGVEMIRKQMDDLLRRFHVQPVPALGERFDPTVHDAVMREEADAVEEPTVTAELQRGYTLHERLIRPAMVKVAMPSPRPEKKSGE